MIGGLNKTASALAITAAAGVMSTSAFAADLGGNCCADLEERVAELEATTVRKGNRVVSLTLSGHVNEAVTYYDDGINDGARIVTNGFSMSRFRMRGSAKIDSDWSAGFYLEFGVGRTGMSYDVDQRSGNQFGGYNVATRHEALYFKSKSWGTFWIGHTGSASDGIHDICVGCTITSTVESGLGYNDYYVGNDGNYFGSAANLVGVQFDSLGIGQKTYWATRHNLIKYISPSIYGFSFSASWGDADDGDTTVGTDGDEHGYRYDVALRYANEWNGFRVAAGVGYTNLDYEDQDSWAVAASAQHVPTGLYIQGTYRTRDNGECSAGTIAANVCDTDDDGWSIQVGWNTKWNSLGKTNFWFSYSNYDNGSRNYDGDTLIIGSNDGDVYSFGINQKIDAAATELYLTYWNVQTDLNDVTGSNDGEANPSLEDLNMVMAGARIKF